MRRSNQPTARRRSLRRLGRRKGPAAPTPAAPGRPAVRDFQRSRVYTGEAQALERVPQLTFASVAQVQAYIDDLVASPWFLRRWPPVAVTVKDGRGSRRARTDGREWIALPRAMRREWVVLHELAHCLAPDKHGPLFCACYLQLVARQLGAEAEAALRGAFDQHRVKVAVEA